MEYVDTIWSSSMYRPPTKKKQKQKKPTTTKHLSLLTFAYGYLDKTLSNFFQIHLAHVVSF